jgi:hypothetical protein
MSNDHIRASCMASIANPRRVETDPDPQLADAFRARFVKWCALDAEWGGGHIVTERSRWGLYVGPSMCHETSAVHPTLIVLRTVNVDDAFQRTGIFRQGMNMLRDEWIPAAKARGIVIESILNANLYQWAIKQPGAYVSAACPNTVTLYAPDVVVNEKTNLITAGVVTPDVIRAISDEYTHEYAERHDGELPPYPFVSERRLRERIQ